MIKEVILTHYEQRLKEQQKLQKQIDSLQQQIKNLPDVKLIRAHNKNWYLWYQSNGRSKSYIPPNNRQLAEQLAIKKYLSLRIEELSQEKKAIDSYLNKYPLKSEQLLRCHSGYQELLSPFFSPKSKELTDWM